MRLVVDPPELHKAADKFRELAEEYSTVYLRLINSASTMGEAWKAADNLAFVDQIKGFCDELKTMAGHLVQAGSALDMQAKNYEDVRDNNISSVKQLAN